LSDIQYSPEDDYYELFGLEPTASVDEIAKAHKRLAKGCHPDLHPDKGWATERFKEINRVYAVLRDPVAKGEYDRLRWAEMGKNRAQERPTAPGEVEKPRRRGGGLDAERHDKDRMMSHFILGIEVVVLGFFMVLVVYAALKKLNP